MTILLDGISYRSLATYSENRALILYRLVPVFVDLVNGQWELSGEPARPGQETIDYDANLQDVPDGPNLSQT